MAKWRNTTRIHTFLYRVTRGLVGHRFGPFQMLLLTTTGRKSGLERTLPLAYLDDGEDYVVLASNGGQEHPPLWWKNLEARPQATVQVGSERFLADAREARGADRDRLWPRILSENAMWASYARTTRREIPVVILHRTAPR